MTTETLCPLFLALRRVALIAAAKRVFWGCKDPIPVIPAWPGIYQPPVKGVLLTKPVSDRPKRRATPRTNIKRPGAYSSASCDLAPGTLVPAVRGVGRIVALIPMGANPMDSVPPGTKNRYLPHAHNRYPAQIPRYCLAITLHDGIHYQFPKASVAERLAKLVS